MLYIIHQVNSIEHLRQIPSQYGVEIDVRAFGPKLILNHNSFEEGDTLEEYLKNYKHKFIIFNIKEAGIESAVMDLAKRYSIENYFLLDVEFPYIYRAARKGVRKIAMRYSEDESIETVLKYKGMVDWVWIDTNTRLPLDENVKEKLKSFKTCLVCPERWGRPYDIPVYKKMLTELDFKIDAVMTTLRYVGEWSK